MLVMLVKVRGLGLNNPPPPQHYILLNFLYLMLDFSRFIWYTLGRKKEVLI